MEEKHVVIVGGGFGGVKAALELSRRNIPNLKITLISNKSHFEYYPLFYRVLHGNTPLEVCIPLLEIFKDTHVQIIKDTVENVDIKKKIIIGKSGSVYNYNFTILALGSEPAYYKIEGLQELSFNVQSINGILKLKRHIHETFQECQIITSEEKNCNAHILVVGGGTAGCGIAAELATYARKVALNHGLDSSYVTIDLIHAGSQLIPTLPKDMSEKVKQRLYNLGVNIFLNRRVMREEIKEVHMKDMKMKTKTLVWCAGVSPNSVYGKIDGFTYDTKGKVIVDAYMQGFENVFVIGDGASMPFSGLALTAIADSHYVIELIEHKMKRLSFHEYKQIKPHPVIPVGSGWGVYVFGSLKLHGKFVWWIKRFMDLRFFMSILPIEKAIQAYREDAILCETCSICGKI